MAGLVEREIHHCFGFFFPKGEADILEQWEQTGDHSDHHT